MKFLGRDAYLQSLGSHPARGAWIEITITTGTGEPGPSRTPHGVRGLKYQRRFLKFLLVQVAPRTGCVD